MCVCLFLLTTTILSLVFSKKKKNYSTKFGVRCNILVLSCLSHVVD